MYVNFISKSMCEHTNTLKEIMDPSLMKRIRFLRDPI